MKNVHTCESAFLRVSDCFIETEEDLDNALRKGDFDAINQTLTPKTLARCKTNSLLKSLQVGLVILYLPILPIYFTLGCFARLGKKCNPYSLWFCFTTLYD